MFLFPTKTPDCKSSKRNYVVHRLHRTSISITSPNLPTASLVPISATLSKEPRKWPLKKVSPSTLNAKNEPRRLVPKKTWTWKIQFLRSDVNISKRPCNMLDEVLVIVI